MDDRGDLARLAFDLATRALERQEQALDELRARAGTVLAAGSIATSFIGSRALAGESERGLVALALATFAGSVLLALYVLLPKTNLVFSVSASVLYEREYADPGGIPETHRRLAYWLDAFREANQVTVDRMIGAFRWATYLVLATILMWTAELLL